MTSLTDASSAATRAALFTLVRQLGRAGVIRLEQGAVMLDAALDTIMTAGLETGERDRLILQLNEEWSQAGRR